MEVFPGFRLQVATQQFENENTQPRIRTGTIMQIPLTAETSRLF